MLIMRHRTHAASASSWERILPEVRPRQRYRAGPPQGLGGDYAFCPLVAFVAVASACLEVGKRSTGEDQHGSKIRLVPLHTCGFNMRPGVFRTHAHQKKNNPREPVVYKGD